MSGHMGSFVPAEAAVTIVECGPPDPGDQEHAVALEADRVDREGGGGALQRLEPLGVHSPQMRIATAAVAFRSSRSLRTMPIHEKRRA